MSTAKERPHASEEERPGRRAGPHPRDRQGRQAGRRLRRGPLRRLHRARHRGRPRRRRRTSTSSRSPSTTRRSCTPAGRIPGSYFRREGRLTEKETLTSRIVDRSCRPLFPEGYANETQIIATVISFDQENDADVLALTGASAALMRLRHPLQRPHRRRPRRPRRRAVRRQPHARPARAESDLDVVMAASRDAIVMVEGGAERGLRGGHGRRARSSATGRGAAAPRRPGLDAPRARRKTPRVRLRGRRQPTTRCEAKVKALAWDEDQGRPTASHEKHDRYGRALRGQEGAARGAQGRAAGDDGVHPGRREKEIKALYEDLKYEYMREITVKGGRIGGRGTTTSASITCEVGLLPRVARLGALHPRRDPGAGGRHPRHRRRRAAHRAADRHDLQAVHAPLQLPAVLGGRGQAPARPGPPRDRPRRAGRARAARHAAARATSSPTPSASSPTSSSRTARSSMASVCGGCLALMDAGVPIKAPVAGIAMGLIKEGEKIAILSDILGDEDHLGDMDFKVCGTDERHHRRSRWTSRSPASTREIMEQGARAGPPRAAAHPRRDGQGARRAARRTISQYAPRITTIMIRPEFIKNVIGPGGKVIKDIIARTGCSHQHRGRRAESTSPAPTRGRCEQAIKMIQALTREAEVGQDLPGHGPQDRRVRRLRGDLPRHRRPDPHLRALRQAREERSPTSSRRATR